MRDRSGETKHENQGDNNDADNHKNRADDAADFAGLRRAPTGGVHPSSVYLLEVVGAEHPGHDGHRRANNQSENAENENESAAMWFHILSSRLNGWFLWFLLKALV
jgi:hypothetical protein